MNKKGKGKFVGFSNDELNYGIPEPDKKMIFEMRGVLEEAKNKLRQVFRKEIKRLDVFIKQEYSVIPTEDDFIKWFEQNKLYKNWEGLPKISDEDIFNLHKVI